MLKACAGGGGGLWGILLAGKGYYGDASKAKNEVILSDG